MILRLRGDYTRDIELTDRVQIPQVAELLCLIDVDDEQWLRVREVRRAAVITGGRVSGYDIMALVNAVGPPVDDTRGPDRPEQMELGPAG